jgi:predicted ATPase/DNA-binding SARP family transcriptional activator
MQAVNESASLEIRLFGPFNVTVGGEALPPLRSRKGQWLLALLTLRAGREVERSWLAGTLWPDHSESQALSSLRRSLTDLRTALGAEAGRLRSPTPHSLLLELQGAHADVVEFDAAAGNPDTLERAVGSYGGPLLEGCTEEWVFQERQAREESFLRALEELAAAAMARGEPQAAERSLRRAAATDPLRETAQRALMRALAANGNYAAALLTYRELRQRLYEELNAEPDAETTAVFQELREEASRKAAATAQARPGVPAESRTGKTADGGRWSADDRRQTAAGGERMEGGGDPSSVDCPSSSVGVEFLEDQPAGSVPASTVRLPRPLTRFVGRERQVQEVVGLLEQARLVTLTGPGGVGKTRLAIRAGEVMAEGNARGIWFVDLASLGAPDLVPQALAAALDLREEPDRLVAAVLVEFLRPRRSLLILDGCEHLLAEEAARPGEAAGGCAALVEYLLQDCPELRILATSRHAFGIVGEVAWPVPSLTVPEEGSLGRPVANSNSNSESAVRSPGAEVQSRRSSSSSSSIGELPAELLHSEAVQLFVERARAVVASFAVTEARAAAVGAICRRLEGIPLAIELAAARLKVLSVEQVAARLDDRFRLLTGGSPTALRRQQTLRATMDWSYELLSEPQRAVLRRLSVFPGAFPLEAAEAVCKDEGGRMKDESGSDPELHPSSFILHPSDVLDLLAQLVDRSLVSVADREGEARYRLLETTRAYAQEQLEGAGEREAVQRGHALHFYNAVMDRREPLHAPGAAAAQALAALEESHADLQAALEFLLRPGAPGVDTEHGLRLAEAVTTVWRSRGRFSEARAWLRRALRETPALQAAAEPSSERAAALRSAGYLAIDQGDWGTARALLDEALSMARALGDRRAEAMALMRLGRLSDHLEEYATSQWLYEQCLAIWREEDAQAGIVACLNCLGWVAFAQGDYPAARVYHQACLATNRERGHPHGMAWSYNNLADIFLAEGDLEAARDDYVRSLRLFHEHGAPEGIVECVRGLAQVAAAQCEDPAAARQAAQLAAALHRLREETGVRLMPPERAAHERSVARVAAVMGEPAFSTAWAEGLALSLEEAIALAAAAGATAAAQAPSSPSSEA